MHMYDSVPSTIPDAPTSVSHNANESATMICTKSHSHFADKSKQNVATTFEHLCVEVEALMKTGKLKRGETMMIASDGCIAVETGTYRIFIDHDAIGTPGDKERTTLSMHSMQPTRNKPMNMRKNGACMNDW